MPELVPDEISAIISATPKFQRAFLVGGCIRDWLLGIPNKDFDIEVYGVSFGELVEALSRHGKPDLVGRSFGVAKLTTVSGINFDFSIPRRDSKIAPGHKGFETTFDPDITPEQGATRRDFTINSLMYDLRDRRLLDFFGGQDDLNRRILRHTSGAFTEDPLRVLRGMQFVSRFGLTAAPETVELCRRIKSGYHELAIERVREEWFKWASKSSTPSHGLKFLVSTGWIEHFEELETLIATPQDPEWHPEGDVFTHTCHCCDALVELPGWRESSFKERIILSFATLAHDFGKPETTHRTVKHGKERIVSPGHEEAGGRKAKKFLKRIRISKSIVERVIPLVRNHLAHLQTTSDRSVRRLAKRLQPESIENLCLVLAADHFGRPPHAKILPTTITSLQAKAKELEIEKSAPKPILRGRELVAIGLEPGPQIGPILKDAYDAQLDGAITDLASAYQWLSANRLAQLPDSVRANLDQRLAKI